MDKDQSRARMRSDMISTASARGPFSPSRFAEHAELEEALLNRREALALVDALAERGLQFQVSFRLVNGRQWISSSLPELRERLCDDSLEAGQVAYDYAGVRWLDTLIPTREGIRVVRLEVGFSSN